MVKSKRSLKLKLKNEFYSHIFFSFLFHQLINQLSSYKPKSSTKKKTPTWGKGQNGVG